AFGIWGWQQGLWPFWFPVFVFSPFIVDATVTLLKRLCKGERVWEAHKSHYYQRLVQLGWGHRKTAIVEYVLMLLVSLTAILVMSYSAVWVIVAIGFWGLVYATLMGLIDVAWARTNSKSS